MTYEAALEGQLERTEEALRKQNDMLKDRDQHIEKLDAALHRAEEALLTIVHWAAAFEFNEDTAPTIRAIVSDIEAVALGGLRTS